MNPKIEQKDIKNKQLEKWLNELGKLSANATDDLAKANEVTSSISDTLVQIQKIVDQMYITLEEPLELAETK